MKDFLRVFYVEDDIVDQEIFEEVLSNLHKKVSIKLMDSGDQLIDSLLSYQPKPDIVFLDLNMPGKNGFDVLKDMQNLGKPKLPPVVVFSTSSSREHIEKSKTLGAKLYIEKPRNYDTYVKTIHSIISTPW